MCELLKDKHIVKNFDSYHKGNANYWDKEDWVENRGGRICWEVDSRDEITAPNRKIFMTSVHKNK